MGLRDWAQTLRVDAHAVWLAARDARTPWYAKLLGVVIAAYALSPVDLIPDFIPVIGLLDDLILIPAGLWLLVRLIPAGEMAEHRAAAEVASHRPVSWTAAVVITLVWLALAASLGWSLYSYRYW